MKNKILIKLQEIEKQHDIKILYACESGSRAWGFPSPDSDYDVRFIYAQPLNSYLTVQKRKDELSFPISDELDINGWDISKTLLLMGKSNTTVFEWLQSPVVYYEDKLFRDELWQLSQQYFCARSNIHHYLGIAKGAMATINEDKVRIKKLFYILRPLLAALWCSKKGTIAPMNIDPLMELLPEDLKQDVMTLIELKATSPERFETNMKDSFTRWINETYNYCQENSMQLEKQQLELSGLDEHFRKFLTMY